MTKPAASIDRETASKVPFTIQLDRRNILGGAAAASAATALMPLATSSLAASGLAQINPAEETIRLGPLAVRFLVTGSHSSGSLAAFELSVPGRQRLAAPAHSHDKYEETSTASTAC